MQDTLVHERPPRRRLERIHQKTNVKRDKVNRTKNNDILLYELGEAFRHIFSYLGIQESASKAAVSRTFSNSVDAWIANKQDLDLLHENLSHIRVCKINCLTFTKKKKQLLLFLVTTHPNFNSRLLRFLYTTSCGRPQASIFVLFFPNFIFSTFT